MNAALYYLYLAFFISHIPITLFVDSQAGEDRTAHSAATHSAQQSPTRAWLPATPLNLFLVVVRVLQCCRRHGTHRLPEICRRGTLPPTKIPW